MIRRKMLGISVSVLLLLVAGTAFAFVFPPRVSWMPAELKPTSIAPGESASYTLTLKHTGLLPIPATNQLRIVAEGDMAPYVTIIQPKFPPSFKRGDQVTVQVTVNVPTATSLSVKTGQLVLQRILPNGKVKDVWRAEELPVELTFSSFPLPPDPGEAGNATIAGIDVDGNMVRDDIDRYIVFTYPDSAKVREALKQEASSMTPFLLDADDKQKSREHSLVLGKTLDCLIHVFNTDLDAVDAAQDALLAKLLNTRERSRAYNKADAHLGGMVSDDGPSSERFARRRAACAFDPDALPN